VALSSNLESPLVLLGLGAARTLPLAWSIPVFGGPALPFGLRVAVGLGLAGFCYPLLATTPLPGNAAALVVLALRELLVGVVMGLVCACMFRAAEAAGEIVELAGGSELARTTAPTGEGGSSPFGVLFLLLASVVFLEIGGVGHVASALARSYEALPLDVSLAVGPRAEPAAWLVIASTAKLIEAAVALAAPVLVALLLADAVLGVLGRAVPGIPVYSAAMPMRTLLGVGAVLLALGGIHLALPGGFRAFFALLESALRGGR
jgi:flagellar biosynthetic protein FliR